MPELDSSGSVRGCPAMAIPTAILDPQRPFASLVSNGGPCPFGHSRSRTRITIIANANRRLAGWAERSPALDPGKGKMKLPQTGGCLCGKIRYEISEAPRLVYTCHCTECQRLTSSAFSIALAVAGFRLTGDEPKPLESIADSGRVKVRWVCPECGCWLFSTGKPGDGLHRVRAGTLDDTSWLCPTMHFWTRNKQPWITLPGGDQTFETQPG
jgi:hypothetical protein